MRRVRRIRRRKLNSAVGATTGVDEATTSNAEDQVSTNASRVVIVGNRIFNLKLKTLVANEPDFSVVATADTVKDALAYPNEYSAELTVVDVDFGGSGQGVTLARDLNERSPGCAFMLVCGPFTSSTAKALWIYGADSWSVITQATAKNPAHFAEAVSSAVHGMPWVEPGINRELRGYGPRPNSFDERKLAILDKWQPPAA